MKLHALALGAATLALTFTGSLAQEIKLGATLSTTGPAASLGIPMKNTLQILPKEIDGVPVSWTILDDGTDTTLARRNTEKLTRTMWISSSAATPRPPRSRRWEIAGRTQTPVLAIAPSPGIIEPVEGAKTWSSRCRWASGNWRSARSPAMSRRGVKTIGFIGFNDALGEGWLKEFERFAAAFASPSRRWKKYARTDTSVVAQVLKVLASRPDAVFVAATGTPAVLPTASCASGATGADLSGVRRGQ